MRLYAWLLLVFVPGCAGGLREAEWEPPLRARRALVLDREVTGSTMVQPDRGGSTCTGGGIAGKQSAHAYAFTPPRTATYRFDVTAEYDAVAEDSPAASTLACVPIPSPTDEDLLAVGGTHRSVGIPGRVSRTHSHDTFAIGRAATALRAEGSGDATFRRDRALGATTTTLRAIADNDWAWSRGEPDTFMVGDAGVLLLMRQYDTSPPIVQTIEFPGKPDLHGVAWQQLDAFIVGAHGTILHAKTEGVTLLEVVFD